MLEGTWVCPVLERSIDEFSTLSLLVCETAGEKSQNWEVNSHISHCRSSLHLTLDGVYLFGFVICKQQILICFHKNKFDAISVFTYC